MTHPSSNLDLAQELVALVDTIDNKGISDTRPELPWSKISAAVEELRRMKVTAVETPAPTSNHDLSADCRHAIELQHCARCMREEITRLRAALLRVDCTCDCSGPEDGHDSACNVSIADRALKGSSVETSARQSKIAAQIAHAALHILGDWSEENAQTGEVTVEIPAHEWKELNRVIDLLGGGDFADAHEVLHDLIGVNDRGTSEVASSPTDHRGCNQTAETTATPVQPAEKTSGSEPSVDFPGEFCPDDDDPGLYDPTKQEKAEPECSTCNDTGEVDETLGGHSSSDPHAPCPDCRPVKASAPQ